MYNFDDVYKALVKAEEHDMISSDIDEEEMFHCPYCGEPIYKEDYPELDVSDGLLICPICEFDIGEIEIEEV